MSKLDEYEKDPANFDVNEENVDSLINELGDEPEGDGEEPTAADDETGKEPEEGEKPEEDAKGEKAETDEKSEKNTADKELEEKSEEEKGEKEQSEEEARQVIKTRDGKHEIPYSVLEETRRQLRETQRQLDELKGNGTGEDKAPEQQPTSGQERSDKPAASAEMDDETYERWKEEFGKDIADQERERRQELADLRARQAELQEKLEKSEKWREEQEQKSQEDENSQINEAIDSIDKLRQWRDSEDPMWDAAVALDNRLMADPEYRGKSYRERFETVVEKLTGTAPNQKSSESEGDDDTNIREKVEKKLADQDRRQTTAPNSLSDVPGGTPTDQSDADTLDRLTPKQLEAKLENMSAEQMEEYLARL